MKNCFHRRILCYFSSYNGFISPIDMQQNKVREHTSYSAECLTVGMLLELLRLLLMLIANFTPHTLGRAARFFKYLFNQIRGFYV